MKNVEITTYKNIHLGFQRLEDERQKARETVEKFVRAPNTMRAYAHDWARFQAWCALRGVRALPSDAQDVCAHLAWMEALDGDTRLSLSAIERAYSAIALHHRAVSAPGWQPPKGYPADVMLLLGAIRRKRGTAQHGKEPIIKKDLVRIVAALPDDLRGTRDRALLLLGFWMACRRSEIIALDVDDVRVNDEGVTIHLHRSKTDQTGKGEDKAALRRTDALCPARAVEAWMNRGDIRSGALLRGIDRWGHISPDRLADNTYSGVVKKACERIGLDASDFAGHSLRSGFVTTAARKKSLQTIASQTGHKDMRTLMRYIRRATLFDDNATDGL